MNTVSLQPLIVPGTLDSLQPIAAYVLSAAQKTGLDKKTTYNLRLAIDEIATNIILHGYEEAGLSGDLSLQAEITDTQLAIAIEDTAIPYDPQTTKDLDTTDLQRPLVDRAIGGLGVFLALQGIDQFHYERLGDRNRNVLIVNFVVNPPTLNS